MERVGILYAADRAVRKLSKGMLQRTGLAAALVADPELLILDEPMSGLDPVGRKDVRDVILDERARGRTVFFSTHILGDVEMLCDHVTILRKGVAVVSGNLSELLRRDVQRTDVTLVGHVPAFEQWCRDEELAVRRDGERLEIAVEGAERLAGIVKRAVDDGLVVVEVRPRSETLEDLFLREAIAEKVA
jgi:ABC-2 type transport system ATP-binding protein